MAVNLQIYDYVLIGTAVLFAALFLYTTCRLMCNCSIYGCQKGMVVPLLTTTYILTLFINAIMILLILIYEIDIHYNKYHQHSKIPNIIQIVGLYAILWFNFMLNSLTICCWFHLFADLFDFKSKNTKTIITITLISSLIYLIIIIIAYVLIEITNTIKLTLLLPILSYINLLPLVINIIIALYSLCKLPLSQPIDLSIGLYQKNTLCSCYTTITQYIWSMIIIPLSQSIILIINILEIDIWNFDSPNENKFMDFITSNMAKLIFFISQFIALLFLWNFLGISIKQNFHLNTVLDVLTGKYDTQKMKSINEEMTVNVETMTKLTSIEDDTPTKSIDDNNGKITINNIPTEEPIKQDEIHVLKNNESPQKDKSEETFEIYGDPKDDDNDDNDNDIYDSDEIAQEAEEHFDETQAVIIDAPPVVKGRNRIFTVTNMDPEQNFRITEPLGEGAYGPVFAAIDNRDGQMVALKVMNFNPNDCKDLLSEIDILQKCNSPYIVNFKDTFHKDNNIWLAMEYCDGGSILDVMKILNQNLTELQTACVIYQSLKGLMYLHSKQLIHRDIKAANILINSAGCCKLADFGVAKIMRASGVGTTIGSPYWMAPEVMGSDNYDISADIWSLGIVCVEMSVGKPPLSEYKPMQAMFMIPKNPPPKIPEYIIEELNFSNEFIEFIGRCLQKNPAMRPSAEMLINDKWVKKVENDYMSELLPWISKGIPLLDKERKINAHIANQEDSENTVVREDDIEMTEIGHQPTGTFMEMNGFENDIQEMTRIENDYGDENGSVIENGSVVMNGSVIENDDYDDDYDYDDDENGSVIENEDTEIRRGDSDSTSSSSDGESEPSNIVVKF